MQTLEEKIEQTIWAAHALFDRAKTSGTTANISFRDGDKIYISRSGSCFGTMGKDDFAVISIDGENLDPSKKPSKEFPLHLKMYTSDPETQAVIHVHSPYAVLWSCIEHENERDVMPHITPYLDMKLGKVVSVPYAAPGSKELFDSFESICGAERGYLLAKHGPVVGGKNMMNAFEAIEELEQTAFVAWEMRKC